MSSKRMRVKIPINPKAKIDLAQNIYTKHTSLATDSPLSVIEENNWTDEGPKIALCLAKHKEAEALKDQAEAAYKDRNILLADITKAIRASRDVLTGANRDNLKRLTEWGFDVAESVKKTSTKTEGTK
jgi:hypothetical protein